MIKIDQTVLHNPPEEIGNCFRACVASILEMSIEDIPPFEETMFAGGDWVQEVKEWSYSQNYLMRFWWEEDSSKDPLENLPIDCQGLPVLVTGPSPRFPEVGHCVVYKDGEFVHDPHPSRDEIDGDPIDCIAFIPLK